ncbi:MAG: hypothetical protein KTR31_24705 [Myxococcales bacterium]|nr:hypothetical protein [Myxococcales bacterium]
MYGILEGEPFQVFARRNVNGPNLVIRFECKEGMGILGIRKSGREEPPPSSAYEEENIEPSSLRAGRFVHVLQSGQRQSYALSRISSEVAGRLPTDSWVELKPQTEFGFRYLIVDEGALGAAPRTTSAADEPTRPPDAGAPRPPRPTAAPSTASAPSAPPPASAAAQPVPAQPQLTEAAIARLTKEQAVDHLRTELARVRTLEQRLKDLQSVVQRSKQRERDLLELLGKWQGGE